MDRYLLVLAILPGLVLAVLVYRQDRIEKEPVGMLIKMFLLGALSIIPAFVFEMIGAGILGELGIDPESELGILLDCFVVVAVSEELGKYLGLSLFGWKHKEFNYRFDGIVYAVCVSLGFAIPENIMYVSDGGLSTALLRAVTSIPGHVTFAIFMGYYFGQAKFAARCGYKGEKIRNLIRAGLVPILIHGMYDYCCSSNYTLPAILFVPFIIFIDVKSFIRVRCSAKHDIRVTEPEPGIPTCIEDDPMFIPAYPAKNNVTYVEKTPEQKEMLYEEYARKEKIRQAEYEMAVAKGLIPTDFNNMGDNNGQ